MTGGHGSLGGLARSMICQSMGIAREEVIKNLAFLEKNGFVISQHTEGQFSTGRNRQVLSLIAADSLVKLSLPLVR